MEILFACGNSRSYSIDLYTLILLKISVIVCANVGTGCPGALPDRASAVSIYSHSPGQYSKLKLVWTVADAPTRHRTLRYFSEAISPDSPPATCLPQSKIYPSENGATFAQNYYQILLHAFLRLRFRKGNETKGSFSTNPKSLGEDFIQR